jgi:hypothetical protein
LMLMKDVRPTRTQLPIPRKRHNPGLGSRRVGVAAASFYVAQAQPSCERAITTSGARSYRRFNSSRRSSASMRSDKARSAQAHILCKVLTTQLDTNFHANADRS